LLSPNISPIFPIVQDRLVRKYAEGKGRDDGQAGTADREEINSLTPALVRVLQKIVIDNGLDTFTDVKETFANA